MTTETPTPKSNRGRKPGTKFTQRPRSDHEKAKRVQIPPEPTIDRAKDRQAAEIQQAARIEVLMLRGISSPHILQSLLGIGTEKEVNRLITLVEARWAITGRGRDLTRYRGAALARLDLLTSEMWSRLSSDNADLKPSDRVAMIRTILDIECQRNMLLGLSQTVITRMATLPNTGTGISGAIADQQALAATAGRFLELIAQRRREAGKAEVELIEAEAIDDAEAEYIYFEDAETEITAH